MTELTEAAKSGNTISVRKLLDGGADASGKNPAGFTTLMLAVRWSGDKNLVRSLIAAGAEVNARHGCGDTLLTMAVKAGRPEVSRPVSKSMASHCSNIPHK